MPTPKKPVADDDGPRSPLGSDRFLFESGRFRVKEIIVPPDGKHLLQKHLHRSEHWVVVPGTAIVTRDRDSIVAHESDAVLLPLGCIHRMVSPDKIDLVPIEVDTGFYLAEGEIIRLDDYHGRA